MSRRRADPRGFLLLEVLVAFVIAAMALAVLFQGALGGVRAAQVSGRTQEALARARSHLAEAAIAPSPQDLQGDEADGFHWHVRIVPLQTTAVRTAGNGPGQEAARQRLALYSVIVTISWGSDDRRRAVTLRTESIGEAPGRGV